ncbi:MAG: PAS domain S-box protein, partial [Chloroflexota bacterium]
MTERLLVFHDITERKRAEDERAQLLNVLETTLNEIYIFDAETLRFQYVNQGALRNLGYAREAMSAMTPLDLKPEFDLASFRNLLGPLLRREMEELVFHTMHRRADDSLYPVEVHLQLSNVNGKRAFHAIILDITERKLAEKEILAARNQLQATLEAIPDPLFELGLDGRYYDYHSQRTDLLAASREEFLGKTVADILPPKAAEVVMSAVREAYENGRANSRQFELQLPRGGLWFELSVSCKASAPGQEPRFVVLSRDITARKLAEEAITESERRLTTVIANLPGYVYRVGNDKNHTPQFISEGVIHITGYTQREYLVDRTISCGAEIHLDDRGRMWQIVQQSIAAGEPYECEYRIHTKSGALKWMWERGRGNFAPSGELLSLEGFVTDITERKQAEAALANANTDLERALLNANELAVAAQAANRAKSEFLANMSHEIRTPLTAVLGLTEMTLASELTDEQHTWLGQVYTSGQALLELINNILDLSKIEAARLELDKVKFELPALIQQVTTTLAARAAAKQLDFNYSLSVDLPQVLVGDPVRLRQVLLNLLDNAIKFTERGEVSLRVRVEAQTADEVTLHFAVRDTGLGIPEDKQVLIFEPFTQADGHIARQFGGTGLGLTISQRLVEKFGGLLWVESRAGEGSTFHFTALFALPAQSGGPGEVEKASVEDTGPTKEYPLNILLAEDNPANQIVLSNMLKKRGWQVTLAGTGREALERVA